MGINNGKAKMNDCGAINKTSTISWGSPMIILITNNLNFDIYDLEIREIEYKYHLNLFKKRKYYFLICISVINKENKILVWLIIRIIRIIQ
jgi:hypothetical protein